MLKNSAIKLTANKLANSSLLSGSLILVGGFVVWRLWNKQEQLQTETSKLSMQLKNVKRQVAEIKSTNEGKSDTPLSSTFKKFFSR
jgi:predicted negative regulator of RcsB-dependent stress response